VAKPRTPAVKAKATGYDVAHKARVADRAEPVVIEGVGEPFTWLKEDEQKAWREIALEVPWLNHSHRGFLAIAANIRGRMMAGGDVGVQALNLLRQCYGQMGATPADASKAGAPNGEGKTDDPTAEFFPD
jgi:hypothetical protein